MTLPDLAPTFLEAAGLTPPEVMTARSLAGVLKSDKSGLVDPSRTFAIVGRERHVAKARAGDQRALGTLFQRHVPKMRRWASGRLPRWARGMVDTDDIIQETLLKTVANIEAFEVRRDGALQAYLRQALRNRVVDEVRKATRRPRIDEISERHPDAGASDAGSTAHFCLQV